MKSSKGVRLGAFYFT